MKTAEYNFFLPKELIALRPLDNRDDSRLLVLYKNSTLEHRKFNELPLFLNPGDMLLINNTKVFPARLCCFKPTGGKLEILLVNEISPGVWNILSKEKYSGYLRVSESLTLKISEGKTAYFENHNDFMNQIWKEGKMPLPPYIKRQPDQTDRERYQTVYAEIQGSIAAPTAGLHFTKELIDNLVSKSVLVRTVTLHIGTGTFKPIRTDRLEGHRMDEELFEINPALISEIKQVKISGGKIIAVGTSTTRALEGYFSSRCRTFSSNGVIKGSTDIFIYKGYKFMAVDSLITNFHLPRSTPLMLTSALAGKNNLLKAYKTAVAMRYRFFSYGDAMLVL